ncbi:conserved hypothetical protein [Hyphomicrobiales bacterium]|jgi:hypothetical protein|nr:conserved hypothetical protein [Hyphomicrobiales bacterium]CAH1702602.1 conserved hypothetical protein [Hyphomicrobiales bacterium]CAI0346805.1 conserved hypothetical protein [Hyphomicrobiales bacterium]
MSVETIQSEATFHAPEVLANFLLEQRERLRLKAETRAFSVEFVQTNGITGMSEPDLHMEWFNDVVCDASRRASAAQDPDGSYRAWLAQRVRDPFAVSYRTYDKMKRRWNIESVNLMINVVWHQEIAWAQRTRLSPDDRDAFLANLFLVAAAKDPSRECLRLAEAREIAAQDPAYATAIEHDFPPGQIRMDPNIGARFVPLWLRTYRFQTAERLNTMNGTQMMHLAEKVRQMEKQERRVIVAERAVAACRRNPISRMIGVISVAIEVGWDADLLVAAEQLFLEKLLKGELTLAPDTGLPYTEFTQFVRTTPAEALADLTGPEFNLTSEADLFSVVADSRGFVNALPDNYHNLGAAEVEVFRAWLAPLATRKRAVPRDLVVDYGFHLVAQSFRRIPTFNG